MANHSIRAAQRTWPPGHGGEYRLQNSSIPEYLLVACNISPAPLAACYESLYPGMV